MEIIQSTHDFHQTKSTLVRRSYFCFTMTTENKTRHFKNFQERTREKESRSAGEGLTHSLERLEMFLAFVREGQSLKWDVSPCEVVPLIDRQSLLTDGLTC